MCCAGCSVCSAYRFSVKHQLYDCCKPVHVVANAICVVQATPFAAAFRPVVCAMQATVFALAFRPIMSAVQVTVFASALASAFRPFICAVQATPFASAFRPVIPTRREGGSLPRILPATGHSPPGLFQFAPVRGPDAPALSPGSSQQPPANPPGHMPAPQKPVGSSMSTQGPHTNPNASPQNPNGHMPSQHNPTGHNLTLQRPMAPPSSQFHAAAAVASGKTSAAQVPSQQQVSMPASSQQRQSSASDSVESQGMSSGGPTPQNQARQPSPRPDQQS